jgi:N-acetylmuramoyl-L-alanine amidase
MKVFLNPGHAPNGNPDPGACNNVLGLRECDVAANVANLLEGYLVGAGVEIAGVLQSDYLDEITDTANASGADLFISLHCNAFNGVAKGTETCIYSTGGKGEKLGQCIQSQIVSSLGTVDRGLKERPGLYVLKHTDMTAVLVEMAFIDNGEDAELLRDKQDDFARAIARGVTDYICGGATTAPAAPAPAPAEPVKLGRAKYFSEQEMMCHGASQGHCDCGAGSAENVSPRLLELLDKLRENIGGPLEVSCMYRCPTHNAAVGGVPNSQHVQGTAADVQTPNYQHCHTPEQLKWYAQQLPFDGIGLYDWGVHVDVRQGGVGAGIEW